MLPARSYSFFIIWLTVFQGQRHHILNAECSVSVTEYERENEYDDYDIM